MSKKLKNFSLAEIKKERDEKAKIYNKLKGNSKNEETYKQKLTDFIIDYCSNVFNIKDVQHDLWCGSDYNIKRAIEFRNTMIIAIANTKSYFKSYKIREKKDINLDTEITQSTKKSFNKILDDAFKNVNQKMDIVKEKFSDELIDLRNNYKKHKYENVEEKKIIDEMQTKANQTKQEINNYCYKIICNNIDILKLDNLRQLTNTYSSIVARTLTENLEAINNAIANSNDDELAYIFISAFNQNVKLEKKRVLESTQSTNIM